MITGQKDYVTPKQGMVLKYKGNFDFKKFYTSTKEWLKKNKYILTEKEYKEKWGATGTEFRIQLEGERKIDDQKSFNIWMLIFITNAKKNNEKYSGSFHLNITAYIDLDRKNKWQSNSIKKFLLFVYNNYIIKNELNNVYEDKIYAELMDLINSMKKHVDIK